MYILVQTTYCTFSKLDSKVWGTSSMVMSQLKVCAAFIRFPHEAVFSAPFSSS
jgi:hypothetical protein